MIPFGLRNVLSHEFTVSFFMSEQMWHIAAHCTLFLCLRLSETRLFLIQSYSPPHGHALNLSIITASTNQCNVPSKIPFFISIFKTTSSHIYLNIKIKSFIHAIHYLSIQRVVSFFRKDTKD